MLSFRSCSLIPVLNSQIILMAKDALIRHKWMQSFSHASSLLVAVAYFSIFSLIFSFLFKSLKVNLNDITDVINIWMFKNTDKTHSVVQWLICSLLAWNKGFAILTSIHFSYISKQETWSLLLKSLTMFGNFLGDWENGFCLCFDEDKDTFFRNIFYCFLMKVL